MTSEELDHISNDVIGAAIEVHRILGPGLLESAYEESLAWELGLRKFSLRRQVTIPVFYKDLRIEEGYRADMIVNEGVILELKCVDALEPIHTAQVLTYLKMTKLKLGMLLNFRVDVMRHGIKRVVNNL
jgi:GxxExxY protein